VKSYQEFFAELKRRRLFKVAAVYGAVAFALIQVADPLTKALLLPDAFLTYVAAILLLGFPLALVLAWAFEVTPEGVRKTEPATPGEIAAIVAEPAAKRWSAGVLALIGVAALVATAWWVGRRTDATVAGGSPAATEANLAFTSLENDPRPSIAVLPFVDMSPQDDQEYFSDGMTEELLNTLAKLPELRVAARTSAFAFKNTSLTAAQLGDTLHVGYFVEGSVRKAGDRLRITAQLIDTSSGSHVWSNQYDRKLEDVFAIQTEIAEAIAGELRVPLGIDEGQTLVSPTEDLEAYDLYLGARARMRERGGPGLGEAVRLYRAAIAADSSWAPAWAGLAEALEVRLWYPNAFDGNLLDSATIARDLAAAEGAARRALGLDSRNASAHVALGNVLRDRYDWRPAERAYREAISLDPDNAEAYQQYAELLMASGRIAEAVRVADRTALLDPAPVRYFVLGSALWCDDRTAQAQQAFEAGIERGGGERVGGLWTVLVQLSYAAGKYGEAEEYLREAALSGGTDADSLVETFRRRRNEIERAGAAILPDPFPQLRPMDWLAGGVPDSAAAALATQGYNYGMGLEVSRLYQICRPEYDVVRSEPTLQAYLRERGLDGTLSRTPPSERSEPAALRAAGG